jgi:signal transduction histidine kinase
MSVIYRIIKFLQTIDVRPNEKENQLRLQLLRQLLMILMPIITSLLLVRGAAAIIVGQTPRGAFFAALLSVSALATLYLIASTGHYRGTIWAILLLGSAAILYTVSISDPPYMDLAYFALLLLFAATMFSLRQYILVCGLILLDLLASRLLFLNSLPWDVFANWVVFFCLLETGFFFATLLRLYLENERRRLEMEHQRLSVYRTILSNLNHDFRTPLTIILSCVYLARESRTQSEVFLQRIEHQAHRLTALTEKMLLVTELDARASPSSELTDLVQLTRTITDSLHEDAHKKSLTLNLFMPTTLYGHMDPVDWRNILVNLIENAIKYTEAGGTINLRLDCQMGQVIFEVEDTGIGIGQEDLPHIFEHFYRADKSRSTSLVEGNGLGLAIVKRLVDYYGGSVTVESLVGSGTTFYMRLPIHAKTSVLENSKQA